eukprot:TRINITY_DN40428_c0_g1_i1.p1 TRINITY_DN40428_c0_g1~~TRINITY_DN40428_c0_g1_i1.p1  ORF type:complete len:423 (+),score=68.67 TRINITY_DN40428_c0_g1_i1:59-1327(+)
MQGSIMAADSSRLLQNQKDGRRESRAIWQLGAAMFCVFVAYMPAANLASALHKETGYYANAATYALYVFAAPFAPAIVRHISGRFAFAVGALPYAIFVLANWALDAGFISRALYVVAAALNGFGATLLWTGCGVYTNDAARSFAAARGEDDTKHLGRFNAIPWSLQFVAAASSQLGCAFLLSKLSAQLVFLALGCVGLLGVVVAAALPAVVPPSAESDRQRSSGGIINLLQSAPAARWFALVFLAQGINQGFMFGTFPATVAESLGGSVESAALVMAFNAVADGAAAVGLGRLSDLMGFKHALRLGATCNLTAAALALIPLQAVASSVLVRWCMLLILAALLGCADAGWQTQGSTGIGCLLEERQEQAFALMVMLKGLGSSVSFFVGPLLNLQAKASVLLVCVALALFAISRLPHHNSAHNA